MVYGMSIISSRLLLEFVDVLNVPPIKNPTVSLVVWHIGVVQLLAEHLVTMVDTTMTLQLEEAEAGQRVVRVVLDHQDLQGSLELMEILETTGRREIQELQDKMLLVMSLQLPQTFVSIAQLVHQDHLEGQDLKDQMENQEHLVAQEETRYQDLQDHQGHKVHQERMDYQVTLELLEHQDK
ncbi:hypothetical protein L3Y34_019915 [Caenorhabditis briggsae]|uniref:Uncharacterized protein n=1 Tax=Caenorhabditis briggsae TaxID=6238 RepID=A0AAE9DR85_CAEBR|nr:hypothetical protein L3Y34_019915 [Caenorhabditis briggsae]